MRTHLYHSFARRNAGRSCRMHHLEGAKHAPADVTPCGGSEQRMLRPYTPSPAGGTLPAIGRPVELWGNMLCPQVIPPTAKIGDRYGKLHVVSSGAERWNT